jgi:hypothetical protein
VPLVLLVAALLPVCGASIAVVPTAEELFNRSDLVILGEVVGIESRFGGAAEIYTAVSLRVEAVYKGELAGNLIEVNMPGGDIGPIGVWVEDQPTFKLGERPLLFLTHKIPWLGGVSAYGLTTDTSMGRSYVDGGYTYGPLGDRLLLPNGRPVGGQTQTQLFSDLELLILTFSMLASFALISLPSRGQRYDEA